MVTRHPRVRAHPRGVQCLDGSELFGVDPHKPHGDWVFVLKDGTIHQKDQYTIIVDRYSKSNVVLACVLSMCRMTMSVMSCT